MRGAWRKEERGRRRRRRRVGLLERAGPGRLLGAILSRSRFTFPDARANSVDTVDVERTGRVLSSAHREWEDAGALLPSLHKVFCG